MATGINHRATSDYVTDGPNDTYCLNETYPVTRGRMTFGWEDYHSDGARDRTTAYDVRLAGLRHTENVGVPHRFRVDLVASGNYTIRMSLGDAIYDHPYQYLQLKDDTTVLTTIDDSDGTAIANFDDATGVNRTAANWPGGNLPYSATFSSTICRFVIGTLTDLGGNTTRTHVSIVSVSGGLSIPIAMFHYQHHIGSGV